MSRFLLFILPNVDLLPQVFCGAGASHHLQQWKQKKQGLEFRGTGVGQCTKSATHIALYIMFPLLTFLKLAMVSPWRLKDSQRTQTQQFYQSCGTWSFSDPFFATLINPDCKSHGTKRPLLATTSHLCRDLWFSQSYAYNKLPQPAHPSQMYESNMSLSCSIITN